MTGAERSGSENAPLELHFELNGERRSIHTQRGRTALALLREDLGIKSLKSGCAPQGSCGACALILDGQVRLACTIPVEKLEGRRLLTLDGLDPEESRIYASAFLSGGGVQCGYCTPGMILRLKSLLDTNPSPDEHEIRQAFQAHICRCTGWMGIFRSARIAAALRRGEQTELPPQGQGLVGQSPPRLGGAALALGQRPFAQDLSVPDMLHGALVWTPYPCCRVLSIDPSEALELPGVRDIALAGDFPGARKTGLIIKDWPVMIAVGEETRCVADILAAVAADTPEIARHAASLVKVTVEVLPPVVDLEEAAKDPKNLLSVSRYQRGDVDAALATCAVVVEDTFYTQRVDHAFLEPEASMVLPGPGGSLRVYSCGQGVFDDRRLLCELFALPPEKVVVELVSPGGAFGGKEDLNVQPQAALLALRTGRPVRVALSMEETLRFHPKRHPMILHYKVGADQDGRVQAVSAFVLGDTGGYASVGEKVLERTAGHVTGPYVVPHSRVEARAIFTNNPVSGAMRGFGVNQSAFALEGCLDRIAEKLGLDPLEIRLRNAARCGDRLGSGQVMGQGVGIVDTLLALKPRYEQAIAAGKHVGVACGLKNVGMGNAFAEQGRVVIEVRSPTELVLHTGFTEMGQGHETVLAQMAAQVTGLPFENFKVHCDTTWPVEVGMTTASRATFLGGRGVQVAGALLVKAMERARGELERLVGETFFGEYLTETTHKPGDSEDPVIHFAYGYAAQLVILNERGEIEEIVAVQDVGRAINPLHCRGQVEGAVLMGIGGALTEELRVEGGIPDTRYRALGVIRSGVAPLITPILVEHAEPEGPFGAKGIGEAGLVPTAPAIAAALHSFDGIWRTRLPMRDTPAARALLSPIAAGARRPRS